MTDTNILDHDLRVTETLASRENVVAHFVDEREVLERSYAQTRDGIRGEIAPKIQDTDEWAKRTYSMRLD